jgi:GMP synthase (glutamine-hydrolysing)
MVSTYVILVGVAQWVYVCSQFTPESVAAIRATVGDGHVIGYETFSIVDHWSDVTYFHTFRAVSGGVDSTVAAVLLARAIGDRFHAVLVDNGLLRKNEAAQAGRW